MPYTINDYPAQISPLPKHAKEIWISAFNSAHERADEESSFKIAWGAVKKVYRQVKGKWVVKESIYINELQNRSYELIQEANESLLNEDYDSMNEHYENLSEANMAKTEDGVKYPSAAFAYVPEPEKPSTWKLRLWEDLNKKVTRAQLGRASAALSPGGFRGNRVQIPSEDLPAVKRRIRSEYSKLNVNPDDMPRWVKESTERDYISESCEIMIDEANVSKLSEGIVPVRFLVPGFNSSKSRYYTDNSIRDAAKVFENAKMYADHPTKSELKEKPERSIRDWVATLKNTRVSEKGNAIGEAHIHAGWLKEMVSNLYEQGNINQLATSIFGIGRTTKGTIEGIATNIVEGIIKGKSVDFVTEPGAGGRAGLMESANDVDIISYSDLKEQRPDLLKLMENEILKTRHGGKSMEDLEEQIKNLTESLEKIKNENTDLKAQIAESENQAKIAEVKAEINKLITESELPDVSKNRLEKLWEGKESSEGLTEMIQEEKSYIESLNIVESKPAKVENLGKTAKPKVNLVESFKAMGLSDEEAKLAAGE